MRRSPLCLFVALVLPVLAACSQAPAVTATPDDIATEIAKQQIVAAALTATAQHAAPTPAPPPAATDTPAPMPPTVPLATRVADRVLPPIGEFNELQGEVVLPGYTGSLHDDRPVFSTSVVFYLRVHDPAYGSRDGAGIDSVDFSLEDPLNQIVQKRAEQKVKYCAFGGGEPDCSVWVFAEHGNTWPKAQPVENGTYTVFMTIHRADQKGDVSWQFSFEVQRP